MEVSLFSEKYTVRILTDEDIAAIYRLLSQNTLYYEYCPPFVTHEGIAEDMRALPPGKEMEDKYYIGWFRAGKLIAVMDLIDGYPQKEIEFIGFFMTDVSVQNRGVGSEIIDDLCGHLAGLGFLSVRLAWVKGNPQAEHFWRKNGFVPFGETDNNAVYTVVLAEKELAGKII